MFYNLYEGKNIADLHVEDPFDPKSFMVAVESYYCDNVDDDFVSDKAIVADFDTVVVLGHIRDTKIIVTLVA